VQPSTEFLTECKHVYKLLEKDTVALHGKKQSLLVGDHQPDTFGVFFRTDFLIFNIENKQFDTVQLGFSPN
jgi:hypothetical protein